MKTSIIHLRFEFHHNRSIAFGTLVNEKGEVVLSTSLFEILKFVKQEDLTITNAQEALDLIVRENGFAA